jgi:non-ribosomal peptide synthetase component F
MQLREYEYLPLVTIQEHSELPKGQPLFDSLFVFENAPVEVAVLDRAHSLNATSDSGRTHTNFPLTAVCYPGDDLGLHLSYDQRYFDESTVQRMLGEFKRLLLALVQGFHGDMADLPLLGAQERVPGGRLQPERARLPAGAQLRRTVRSAGRRSIRSASSPVASIAMDLCRIEPPQ